MQLIVIDGFSPSLDQTSSHSIPELKLKILNDTLLIEGTPRYVFVFNDDNTLIGEASIIIKEIALIGNVWVHPNHRKSLILFKMLKKLLEFANQHCVYQYKAHVRDYTSVKPNEYTGRLGIPLLEEEGIFYEYFIKSSPSSVSLMKKILPSSKRSKVIQHFYAKNISVVVEDYANAYQSLDKNDNLVSIGHVTLWEYDSLQTGILALQAVSQFYDYLNFKSDVPICENFNVVKMYKTSVFKNQHAQNKVRKVAL